MPARRKEIDRGVLKLSVPSGRHQRTLMIRRAASSVAGAALLCAAEASASPPCDGPAVTIDPRIDEATRRALEAIVRPMQTLPALDRCARVTITPAGRSLRVEVALADGRVTARTLDDPASLRLWVDPLLVLPPWAVAPPPPAAPVVAPPRAPPRRLRLRLSGETRAQTGASTSIAHGLGLGLLANDVVLGANLSMSHDGAPSVGVEGGVRVAGDLVSLDLLGTARGAWPSIASQGASGGASVSLGAALRVSLHPTERVAPYVSMGLEAALGGPRTATLGERLSPTFAVGFAWESP